MPESHFVEATDTRGRLVRFPVRMDINAADFAGTAIYPWLVMAANPQLSANAISTFLFDSGPPAAYRPGHWLARRRKMFFPPGTKRPTARVGPDHDAALRIMRDNTGLSLRDLVRLLKENGVTRGREWVRQWRYTHLESAN